jgi:hypothetical protein
MSDRVDMLVPSCSGRVAGEDGRPSENANAAVLFIDVPPTAVAGCSESGVAGFYEPLTGYSKCVVTYQLDEGA